MGPPRTRVRRLDEGEGQPERLWDLARLRLLLKDDYPLCLTPHRLHTSTSSTQTNTHAHTRTWDLRGVDASGGGKREWGEGGLGGREEVEDADELVEEVEHLVDGVEEVEVSNILLPLRVYSNTS